MIALALVILGIASRVVPHMSQFTAILAVAMFGGMYLNYRMALVVPVLVMVVSDLILGFHDTMFFTWSSMFLITVLGIFLRKHRNTLSVLFGSVLSALIFFVVTNFGAWLSLYPHTWHGFQECYFLAIPFFRTTLASTVAYSLVLFFAYEWFLRRATNVVHQRT